MAEKQGKTEFLKQVKDTMECCICTETFTDPRMLPCIHSFCLECIQQTGLLSGKQPGDEMPCPVCRKPFKVPPDGFNGLQKNFFIERLVGIISISERAEMFCEVCSGDDGVVAKRPLASVYCVECRENLCETCHGHHQVIRSFKNHRTVPTGSQSHRDALLGNEEKSAVNYCGIHVNERLNHFCFDCKQRSCHMCASAEHSGHKCVHAVKAVAQYEKEIDDEVSGLSSWTQEVVDKRQLLKREVVACYSNVEQVVKGVRERHAALQQLLERHSAALIDELNATKEKKLQKLQNEDKVLEENLKVLGSFKTFCSELTFFAEEAGHIVESIHDRASEIKKQKCGEISAQRLLLKKFDIQSVLDGNENIIGKIQNCSVTVRGTLDTVSHSLFGVARLQNNIYALSQTPNSVLVFDDKTPFALKQSICLVDLQEPCDIAGCQLANCLFISDTGRNSVWKVSIGDNHDVTCWLAERRYISTLSVSSLGHVSVLRHGKNCSLTVYGEDATIINYVLLFNELSSALHAVQKSNGNFVISYGTGLEFGVCEVTNSGNIVYRLNLDDELQRMTYPCHLACGSDDQILVADFYNYRVVLLDSELKISLEILNKPDNELVFPWRLCYDESCHQLLVVHGGMKVTGGRSKITVCEVGSPV